MTHGGPQHTNFPSHDGKCCKVMCFVSKGIIHIVFSKALKFRMCTATENCSDFVSVSIALQSYVTEHRILSIYLLFSVRSNEVQIVLLFFCTFVLFVAVH